MRATVQKENAEAQKSGFFKKIGANSMHTGLFQGLQISSLKAAAVEKSAAGVVSAQSSSSSFSPDGFVYQFINFGTQCTDQPIMAVGLAINTCMSDEGGNSYIYTCNENLATKTKFTGSTSCYGNSDTQTFPLGCTTTINDDDYVQQDYVSISVGCTTDNSDLQLPTGGQYAVGTFFNENTCSGTYAYEGLINNVCFPSGADSYKVNYPQISEYLNTLSCQGSPAAQQTAYPKGCVAQAGPALNDDNQPYFGFASSALMSGGSSSSNAPSSGAIAGVVVGCVIGVALLFSLLFYLVFFRTSSTKGLANQEKK